MKKCSIEPPCRSGSIQSIRLRGPIWGICMDMLRLMGLLLNVAMPWFDDVVFRSPQPLFSATSRHLEMIFRATQPEKMAGPFFWLLEMVYILGITESHQMITKTSRTWYLNSIISRPWTGDRVQVPRQEFVILWGCFLKPRPYKPFQPVPWGQSMLTMTTCTS